MMTKFALSAPGYGRETLRCASGFVGIHANDADELRFSEASLTIDRTWNWLGSSSLENEIDTDDQGVLKKLAVIWTQAPQGEINLDGMRLRFERMVTLGSMAEPKRTIHEIASVRLVFDEELPSTTIVNQHAMAIADFLTLATGRICEIRSVRLSSPRFVRQGTGDRIENVDVLLLLPRVSSHPKEDLLPQQMNFVYSDIEDGAEQFLRSWLEKRQIIKPVFDLYFDVVRSPQMSLHHQFTSLAHALEVLHRRTMQEVDMEACNERVEAVVSSAPEVHRAWLRQKLTFAHEPSLRQRLKQIWERLPACAQKVIGTKKRFAEKVTTIRNYYAHYSAERRGFTSEDEALFCAHLRNALKVLLLMAIGFSESQIEMMANRSGRLLDTPVFIPLD